MKATAEKLVDEAMALPLEDRAFLAHKLLVSLDDPVDPDAAEQWNQVIDRRSREMDEGRLDARLEAEVTREIRAKLHAARRPAS